MNNDAIISFPHTETSLYSATKALHFLAAGLEATREARVYVGELRRATLRAFLDVVRAGKSPTPHSVAQALSSCERRIARATGLLEIMSVLLPRMAEAVSRAGDWCKTIMRAIRVFGLEMAEIERARASEAAKAASVHAEPAAPQPLDAELAVAGPAVLTTGGTLLVPEDYVGQGVAGAGVGACGGDGDGVVDPLLECATLVDDAGSLEPAAAAVAASAAAARAGELVEVMPPA